MKLTERRAWYKMVYQPLVDYHQWLYTDRDPHSEGLVLQIHPWETGLDNTPPWMHELHEHLLPWWVRLAEKSRLEKLMTPFRRDTRSCQLISAFLMSKPWRYLMSNDDWDEKFTILIRSRSCPVAIEDLTFNSIFVRANTCLVEIAKTLREDLPEELVVSMKKTKEALDQLWDPFASEYFSRDFVTHKLLTTSSIGALMPLYAGCITKERAKVLVELLENKHRFGPAYPVPTAPLDSPQFDPMRYWQGPTWVNTNWMIIDGLKRYGFNDHAEALRESTLELIAKSGFTNTLTR